MDFNPNDFVYTRYFLVYRRGQVVMCPALLPSSDLIRLGCSNEHIQIFSYGISPSFDRSRQLEREFESFDSSNWSCVSSNQEILPVLFHLVLCAQRRLTTDSNLFLISAETWFRRFITPLLVPRHFGHDSSAYYVRQSFLWFSDSQDIGLVV